MSSLIETTNRVVSVIMEAKKEIGNHFLVIGKALTFVNEQKLYQSFNGCLTFDEFVHELGLSRTTAYNAMGVYKTFGLYNLEEVPHDRLSRLLPLEIEEDEKPDWIEKARLLPAQAFTDEIREAKGQIATDKCEHGEVKYIAKCKCCGKWLPDFLSDRDSE